MSGENLIVKSHEPAEGKSRTNENRLIWSAIAPKKLNFRHYFGGTALLLVIIQFLTGLYMIFYYEPSLRDTYKTVQYFNNETTLGALTRNIHRYSAFFLGVAVFIHFWRSYFRRDYQGGRKWYWVTGVLLFIAVAASVISGTILPWEWKGYWMMEMFNNWLKNISVIGEDLYTFFMTSYTPTRNFVIHSIMLPIIAFILLEIHCLGKLKKRGLIDYLMRHAVAITPILLLIIGFSFAFPIPSEDPEIIPLPMDGLYIPAPESFFLTLLLPYWYYPPRSWSFYLFWIPFILLTLALILPVVNKKKSKAQLEKMNPFRIWLMSAAYVGAGGILCAFVAAAFLWGSAESPWMGCNSCHNAAMGARMGIPPVTYKDTVRNPLLLDQRWMMRHWYEPQVVW